MARNIVNGLLIQNNKLLLARRSSHRHAYANCWSFPGGHVENGETQEQALKRELREELGIAPQKYSFIYEIKDLNTAEKVTYYLYIIKQWEGNPAIRNDEHSELCWIPLNEANNLKELALDSYLTVFKYLDNYISPDAQADAQ
ncbi:NUDIX domain-containing protein [Paenochrobactrum pullorum]|uniref:NUDIX domain-containing protein n=1 Tax=Paenochrobactrum pullorum TaxID=1324351 RepID=UPI0035BBCD29